MVSIRKSVRPDRAVVRVGPGVHQGEKAFRQFIGLAFTHLIGFDGDQGVMPAFGLHGHSNSTDGAGKLAAAGLLTLRGQTAAEELGSTSQDLVGGKMSAVEVFHSSPNSVNGKQ
jgi:hypothetical protein